MDRFIVNNLRILKNKFGKDEIPGGFGYNK